jgi:hypothetical protein
MGHWGAGEANMTSFHPAPQVSRESYLSFALLVTLPFFFFLLVLFVSLDLDLYLFIYLFL